MHKIFISYRRSDTGPTAVRIYDRLRARFGAESIFMDVDSIPLAVDFRDHIAQSVGQCDVMLAIIGPEWLGQSSGTMRMGDPARRIDDPADFVRNEVEAALNRKIPVIPVLIGHTSMPSHADLPPSLAALAFRNAAQVDSWRDFHIHVDRLIQGIEDVFERQNKGKTAQPGEPAARLVYDLGRPATTPAHEAHVASSKGITPHRRWIWLAAIPLLGIIGWAIKNANTKGPPDVPVKPDPSVLDIQLVPIKAGSFSMGTSEEELKRLESLFPVILAFPFQDEKPPHFVKITKDFYLSRDEITVGQFRRFVDASGYQTEAEKDGKGSEFYNVDGARLELDPTRNWRNPGFSQEDDHPVVCVSYNDAVAFCDWYSKQDDRGYRYRLPTEAEWEYACRAGTTTFYPNGDDPEKLAAIANVADAEAARQYPSLQHIKGDDGFIHTAPVGKFSANSWGLHDMIGNVEEWCSDNYDELYYSRSPAADPLGVSRAPRRVVRGGHWCSFARYCRSAARSSHEPTRRTCLLGFRVAAEK